MKSLKYLTFAAGAVAVLAVAIFAQQPTTNRQQAHELVSMRNMMQNCQKNMQSMMDGHDKVKADIKTAMQSNDPADMRTALEEAEQALNSMDSRMDACMNRMENADGMGAMTRRQTMMDGSMCGMMSNRQKKGQP